jgi:hypothetical protein
MSEPVRCGDLGVLIAISGAPALENDRVKGYANISPIVPEGFYFLLAIELDKKLWMHFGDQFGELSFIAAIYHPSDADMLPTGLLCLGINEFNNWIFMDQTSMQPPEIQEFSLFPTEGFIDNNLKIDQLRPNEFLDKAVLKLAVKSLVEFFCHIKTGTNAAGYRSHCLGIKDTTSAANTLPKEGVELSQAEKDALNPDLGSRRALRLATKTNLVAITLANKVPVGALTSVTKKQSTETKKAGGNPSKKIKSLCGDTPVIDLRTPQQKASDTKAANKLLEEAKIRDAVKKQMDQYKPTQADKQPQYIPPPYSSKSAMEQQVVQHHQSSSVSKAEHRTEMALDFKFVETAVTSYENYADKRMERFIANNK